jgi:hypothetical protein
MATATSFPAPTMDVRLIDRFLPRADIAKRHETLVRAPADMVFDVAERFDLQSIAIVRALFWLRAWLMGGARPTSTTSQELRAARSGHESRRKACGDPLVGAPGSSPISASSRAAIVGTVPEEGYRVGAFGTGWQFRFRSMGSEIRQQANRRLVARLIVVAGLFLGLGTVGPCCDGENDRYCPGTEISAVDCCSQSFVRTSPGSAASVNGGLAAPPSGRLVGLPPPTAPGRGSALSLPALRRVPAPTPALRI